MVHELEDLKGPFATFNPGDERRSFAKLNGKLPSRKTGPITQLSDHEPKLVVVRPLKR
ncbi:MAG: hypothetical protein AMXMBFR19_01650 [Chthonomonadaceae bacterium]|uniref:Uncharacterized protein n=1 Tax=Candidatus Nitrosymbiomonas proteolyticus TaxID=2608984 RepID=A0A809R8E6_9BACT|nr:hypothetical protein NPRO_05230 [Candidatus Nitrosymbiomonas proteolyticus]